jgi:mRNA interferase MazF
LVCPITSREKGYPFEVKLPPGLPVTGVVLADQIKSFDWRARQAEVIGMLPREITTEVINKLGALLDTPG